jgi:hypothetical protein
MKNKKVKKAPTKPKKNSVESEKDTKLAQKKMMRDWIMGKKVI